MRMAEVALPDRVAQKEKRSSRVIFILGLGAFNWHTDPSGVVLLRRASVRLKISGEGR
jgi:hypothetical protein